MTSFSTAREAKEFLVSRMVEEAERENVPLSEVEHKMLYFPEKNWTLPDMPEISDRFDREYDQDEYEKKIVRLVQNAAKHDREQSHEEYDAWWAAIRILQREDHYILVMIGSAGLPPRGDQLKLFVTGLLIASLLVSAGFLNAFLSQKYRTDFGHSLPSSDTVFVYLWLAAVLMAAGYSILRWTVGTHKTEKLIAAVLGRIVGRVKKP
jgi:hypothetical protein